MSGGNAELDAHLRSLIERDAEIGSRAEARVREKYGTSGNDAMSGYDFAQSSRRETQATGRIDWVHQPWLRPIRFAYRHLPKPLRYLLKKVAK